jgi:CheY-like chemotaxis protein
MVEKLCDEKDVILVVDDEEMIAEMIQQMLERRGCQTISFNDPLEALHYYTENSQKITLLITQRDEPTITVDDLEVAQFIYLLLDREKLRSIIDTITTKVVLILGRFTPDRKAILDAIREELRGHNYTPVLFDFDKPATRDLTETISTLAHMARFIIADITDPRSIPQELATIVSYLRSVPIQPLLEGSSMEYGMFEHFKPYPWVLAIHHYLDLNNLVASLKERVIAPAERKVIEVRQAAQGGQ